MICHGGPISEPPDAEYIITNCRGVDGFYGASSVERLPAERAIAEQIRTLQGDPAARGQRVGRAMKVAADEPTRDKRRSASSRRKTRGRSRPVGQALVAVEPELTGTKQLTLVRVTMRPGAGHQFHYHPAREEIIYILDGVAEQWVDREKRRLKAGEMRVHPEEGRARDPQLVEEADDVPGDPVAGDGEGPVPGRLLQRRAVAEDEEGAGTSDQRGR